MNLIKKIEIEFLKAFTSDKVFTTMTSIAMASAPKDVNDFKFVQMRPVQLRTEGKLDDEVFKKPTQLLTVANKFGLIFAGNDTLQTLTHNLSQ